MTQFVMIRPGMSKWYTYFLTNLRCPMKKCASSFLPFMILPPETSKRATSDNSTHPLYFIIAISKIGQQREFYKNFRDSSTGRRSRVLIKTKYRRSFVQQTHLWSPERNISDILKVSPGAIAIINYGLGGAPKRNKSRNEFPLFILCFNYVRD